MMLLLPYFEPIFTMTSLNKQTTPAISPEVAKGFQHPQPQSSNPAYGQIPSAPNLQDITAQIQQLSAEIDKVQNTRINFNTDLIGLFQTVSVVPTAVPQSPYQQIKIYVNSTTYRLYVYDGVGRVWHYATLT